MQVPGKLDFATGPAMAWVPSSEFGIAFGSKDRSGWDKREAGKKVGVEGQDPRKEQGHQKPVAEG